MSRVDIEGQFDVSNPWATLCSRRQEFRINRGQLPPNQQPTNWNQFCDHVDQKLQQLTPLKKRYAWLSAGMFFIIVCLVMPAIVVGNLIMYDKFNPTIYAAYMIVILGFTAGFVITSRNVLVGLNRVFLDISSSCSMYAMGGAVTYELQDEWWGGCAKPYSKRRFFVVNLSGAAGQDVEQQSGGNAASYPAQTYDLANANPPASATPAIGGNAASYPSQTYGQTNVNSTTSTTPAIGGTSGSLFNELSSGI
jgi:hypothetical protein